MTSLADLPLDILAHIHFKGLELARKQKYDEWCDNCWLSADVMITELHIDQTIDNCTLRGFFEALNLQIDEAQLDTLEQYHWTGWDTYTWYDNEIPVDPDDDLCCMCNRRACVLLDRPVGYFLLCAPCYAAEDDL